MLKIMRLVCGVALLVGSASVSHGQEVIDPGLGATRIPEPQDAAPVPRKRRVPVDPYAAQGVAIGQGGIRLYPSIEIGTLITSNVARAANASQADAGVEIRPTLGFASDWSRHSWTGSATADWLQYKNKSDLSTLAGSAQTAFRLDVLRTTHADFAVGYTLSQTGTENSQVPGTAISPRRDRNFTTRAGITHDFGGLETTLTGSLSRSSFDDVALAGGGTENNADRNYWAPALALRGTLGQPGSPLKPFAEMAYVPRFHDQALDRNNQDRDSQGLLLAAGISFDQGPLWQGEVALTDQMRGYADPELGIVNALGLAGRVTWRPTALTTIDATSSVSLDETETRNIGSARTWRTGVNLTHALRDNLQALAGTSFSIQDTGLSVDHTTTATLGLNWQVNPNMAAGVTYEGTWFSPGTGSASYNDQRLMTSIILQK